MCQDKGDVLATGATPPGSLPGAEGRLHDRRESRHRGGLDQPAQRRRQHERTLLLDQPAIALLGDPYQQLDILSKDGADSLVPDGGS
eukprot:11853157-Alexandrium_andersonii.AAC.1